jgi:hypothetical protein
VHSHSTAPRAGSGPTGAPRDIALWFAEQGYPVHPLTPGRKTPAANCWTCRQHRHPPAECPCREQGKWCHGFHSATTNPDHICAWWKHEPAFGVAIACGPANLVVLDIDAHADTLPQRHRLLPGIPIPGQVNLDGLATGYDTVALLAAYRGRPDPAQDTATLRVTTPSGGLHLWYRNPKPEQRYRSSTGSGPKTALAWQVDVRAHNGYIVAPGTITSDGVYTPLAGVRQPAPLPEWIATELQRTGHLLQAPPVPALRRTTSPRRHASHPHRVLRHLLEEVENCAVQTEGAAFTEKLNRAAWTAGGLSAAGHLSHDDAREQLRQAAQHARPHQTHRNEAIIDAALTAGATRPFHPKGTA